MKAESTVRLHVRTFKAALMTDVGMKGGSEVKSGGVFVECTSKRRQEQSLS